MPTSDIPKAAGWFTGPIAWAKQFLSSARNIIGQRSASTPTAVVWPNYGPRRACYDWSWAMYESTLYDDIHPFAKDNKHFNKLFRETDPYFNPAGRLGEFWATHIWTGTLDPAAGDGKNRPSAMPIECKSDNQQEVRNAIARGWRDSSWESNKTLCARLGAVMGDVGLRVDDDVVSGRVSYQVIDPSEILWYESDEYGDCQGYVLGGPRPDPEDDNAECQWWEEAIKDGDEITYRTYKDGKLYPWNGVLAEWSVPYGFVPFVLIPHIKVRPGIPFGRPESWLGRRKFQALDSIATMVWHHIGRSTKSPMLYAGVRPGAQVKTGAREPGPETQGPSQEEFPALFGDAGARVYPIVSNLSIAECVGAINVLINECKDDYPEIRRDIEGAVGDASGKALRWTHKRIETKAADRRAQYDSGFTKIAKMAISIGGYRNYEGYESFSLDSHKNGDLEFRVGERSVFQIDPEDHIDLQQKWYTMLGAADLAGVPTIAAMEIAGRSKDEIEIVKREQKALAALGVSIGRSKQLGGPEMTEVSPGPAERAIPEPSTNGSAA